MDDLMERIPLDDYEQFFDDILSKDQMRPSDELSLLLDEKNEYEYGLFSYINEEPKNRPDIIKNIKESKSKTPKFVTHIFFNPKLKDIKQIMKKKQKKNIRFISRKRNRVRKNESDNINKKIKSKFFSAMRKILKEKVDLRYKTKKPFKFLSYKFLSDITIANNKSYWEETLIEFFEGKLEKGNMALKLIKEDKIGELKLKDVYNDYLNSREFEEDILYIKSRSNFDQNYIDTYKNNARGFINYFLEKQPKKKKMSSQ
jgi:hypothetical protein